MADRVMAGSLGLKGDWLLGEDGWKDDMDVNLLKLSTLAMPIAKDHVAATPGSPTEGDVYIFTAAHPTQANKIAVYDEAAWHYFTPAIGWMCYDTTAAEQKQFDGTAWVIFASGGGGSLPVGGTVGQVLTKDSSTDGDATWHTPASNKFELIFLPSRNEPPTANFATLNVRNNHPVLQFDTTTQEVAIFSGVLPSIYTGAGLVVEAIWTAASATSGTIGWDVSIERIGVSQDIDSDSFATAQTITAATVNATSGIPSKTSVNISSGADMDSLVAGEAFRLRVRRDVANDTATGDAELLAVIVREQ